VTESPTPTGVGHPDLLAIYCNDHLAAAGGGIELVRRMLNEHRGSSHEDGLRQLLRELREEKATLTEVTRALGVPVRHYKQAALWIAEKASRGKLNGHLLSRSPLSSLIEFEVLASAVRAKRSGFETLRIAAEVDERIDKAVLDGLIAQANRQYHWLTDVRREVAAGLFGGDPAVLAGTSEN
jgi:phage I-like protein